MRIPRPRAQDAMGPRGRRIRIETRCGLFVREPNTTRMSTNQSQPHFAFIHLLIHSRFCVFVSYSFFSCCASTCLPHKITLPPTNKLTPAFHHNLPTKFQCNPILSRGHHPLLSATVELAFVHEHNTNERLCLAVQLPPVRLILLRD